MSPSRCDPWWAPIQPRTVPAKRTSAKSDAKSAIRWAPKITQTIATATASAGKLHAVQDFVNKHVAAARVKCPSLIKKRVTPHWLRHTAAMELLQAGVDRETNRTAGRQVSVAD